MVHGNADDLAAPPNDGETIVAPSKKGVSCGIIIVDQCGHAFDLFPKEDKLGLGWAAVEKAYDFACGRLDVKGVGQD